MVLQQCNGVSVEVGRVSLWCFFSLGGLSVTPLHLLACVVWHSLVLCT